jgi:DNA-binding ferritin-like protein (Dps family)
MENVMDSEIVYVALRHLQECLEEFEAATILGKNPEEVTKKDMSQAADLIDQALDTNWMSVEVLS